MEKRKPSRNHCIALVLYHNFAAIPEPRFQILPYEEKLEFFSNVTRPLTLSCRKATDRTCFCPQMRSQPKKISKQKLPHNVIWLLHTTEFKPWSFTTSQFGFFQPFNHPTDPTVQACRHNDITIPLQGPSLYSLRFRQVVFPRKASCWASCIQRPKENHSGCGWRSLPWIIIYIYIYSSPFPVKALDHHLQSTFVLVPHDFSSLE